MTPIQFAALRHLDKVKTVVRQRLIDLAMREPPLVDVDADRVFLTDAGRTAVR